MDALIDSRDSISIIWNKELENFFLKNKIYLQYPWKIKGVFKEGERVEIPKSIRVEPYSNMPARSFISAGAFSYCRSVAVPNDFRMGRYCSVAPLVRLSDQEHPLDRVSTHVFTFREHTARLARTEFGKNIIQHKTKLLKAAPDIGHDVWLGRGCIIKRGLTIGHGAVVAERSIVTKDVPPYAIVAGAPARIVRYRFDEKTIERLLMLRWWEYNFADFGHLDSADVEGFIDGLNEFVATGEIGKYEPEVIDLAEKVSMFFKNKN